MQTLFARLARLAPYFATSKLGFAVAIAGTIVAAATEPIIPALLQPLLDKGFQANALPLWLVPLVLIGLFTLRGAAGFVAQYGLHWAATRGVESMRVTMFERLMTAHPALFTTRTASSLTNTLVYEVQSGTQQLVYSSINLLRDTFTLIALVGYLLWVNWRLTLFIAVLFPAVVFIMRTLSRRLHRLTIAGQGATDELAYVVEENVQAWRIVRLHDAARQQANRFGITSDRLRRISMKSSIAASAMTPLTQIIAACALSAVITAALWQSSGGTSVGSFVSFVTAMLMLVAPIKHLAEVAGPITRGLAALERGVQLIDEAPKERSGDFDPKAVRAGGALSIEGVSVRYGEDREPALKDVSLELRPGETVALVGPSGSGKSTLVNLLPRFIEPASGRIVFDGKPLSDWNVSALRRQFALVSQDVVLFNDSVAANVSLGVEPDRERVRAALTAANLLQFVDSLPEGIDTVVGHNGTGFSGGQRQRLAIARAIYKDAPVLILDEATSALDSESERLVQIALERLMAGRTSIVIAHRLSTVEGADRVAVLDQGRIVESGTHKELLAKGGLFARLHAMQFKS